MSDIEEWLEGLGLARYLELFEKNEIDLDAARHLTESMLAELGIPIGPRAKLLSAISELRGSNQPASRDDYKGGARSKSLTANRLPERRQVTILFCDLAHSTALARRLDPEDLRSIIRNFQQVCSTAIDRHRGYVAQFLGDGIVAYFGWPAAMEGAAEGALLAALEIVESINAIEKPEKLAVRVGVSTGIVVMSETVPGDPSIPPGAVGETPHIAARLQELAQPNSIVISEPTRRLVSAMFVVEDLGEKQLKGIVELRRVFRVAGVRANASRFVAGAIELTPFVGRQAELALLEQRWRDATDGEGQLVLVSGVPGIGKSRIVFELEQRIRREAELCLRLQCSPHHVQSALYPVIQQIERLAEIGSNDDSIARREKLARFLSLNAVQSESSLSLMTGLMSVQDSAVGSPGLSAHQIKDQTLSLIVELLLGMTSKGPICCVVEDAQWIDPSTQELLELFANQIEKRRVLLVVTHRPGYKPRLAHLGNVSALTISRLPRKDVFDLAKLALRNQLTINNVVKRLVEHSDAVPLYVEELARGIVEASASLDGDATHDDTIVSAAWSIPDSLRESLMARLDRAPSGRHVAQIAAVIGREFTYDMLLDVSNLDSAELDATIAHLVENEIIQPVDRSPHGRYAFKHALLRDAAYESLLKSTRAAMHARCALVMERAQPDVVLANPELVAYHYGEGGDPDSAVRYWLIGARRAKSRSANLEAIGQLQRALEIIESLPGDVTREEKELEIRLLLGQCFIAVYGYSAEETGQSFQSAFDLSVSLEDSQKEVQALFGLWGHYWMAAQHDRALHLAESLREKADSLGDHVAICVAHRSIGSTLFTLGEFVDARGHLERAISQAQQEDLSASALRFTVDPSIAARLLLAWDLWILGFPDQALRNVLEALKRAVKSTDPYSIAFAHYVTSAVYLLRGSYAESYRHADKSLSLSLEHGISLYALYSRFGRGCALVMSSKDPSAINDIHAGIEEAQRSRLGYMRAFMLSWLAIARAKNGDRQSALTCIDEGFAHIGVVAGRAWEAELHRIRGDILRSTDPKATQEAESSYREAILVAKNQQARSLELRASVSLAESLKARGRQREAYEVLEPVHNWFTEGASTEDLGRARTMLEFPS